MSTRQTDKETGQNKTREYLTRRMVKRVEKTYSAKPPIDGQKGNSKWKRRERRCNHSFPFDGLGCGELVNNARTKLERVRASAMHCKVTN